MAQFSGIMSLDIDAAGGLVPALSTTLIDSSLSSLDDLDPTLKDQELLKSISSTSIQKILEEALVAPFQPVLFFADLIVSLISESETDMVLTLVEKVAEIESKVSDLIEIALSLPTLPQKIIGLILSDLEKNAEPVFEKMGLNLDEILTNFTMIEEFLLSLIQKAIESVIQPVIEKVTQDLILSVSTAGAGLAANIIALAADIASLGPVDALLKFLGLPSVTDIASELTAGIILAVKPLEDSVKSTLSSVYGEEINDISDPKKLFDKIVTFVSDKISNALPENILMGAISFVMIPVKAIVGFIMFIISSFIPPGDEGQNLEFSFPPLI